MKELLIKSFKKYKVFVGLFATFIISMFLNIAGGGKSIPLLIILIIIYFLIHKIDIVITYLTKEFIIFIRFIFGLFSLQILLLPNTGIIDKFYLDNNWILSFLILLIIALYLHMFISFLLYLYEKIYIPKIKSKKIHIILLIMCLIIILIGTDLIFGMLYLLIAAVFEIKGVGFIESFYFSFSLHYSLPITENSPLYSILTEKFDSSFVVETTNLTFIYISKMIDLLFIAIFADAFLDIFKKNRSYKVEVTKGNNQTR